MKTRKNIEDLVKKWRVASRAEVHERNIADALEAHAEDKRAKTAASHHNVWNIILQSRMGKIGVAAVLIFGIFSGLYYFTGSIDGATPAFADVVENLLSQKWVYMFQEDRKHGIIRDEYWYSRGEGKVYCRENRGGVAMFDLNSRKMYMYNDNKITIRKPDDFDDMVGWLEEQVPLLGNLINRCGNQGAEIVQKEAIYNSKPVLMYEIEVTFPDSNSLRTSKQTWLVDRMTHLPIICEREEIRGRKRNDVYTEGVMSSRRYAFDYSDSGPSDIYALGVPEDTPIIDECSSPEVQELLEKVEAVKSQYGRSCAVIIIERELPRYLIIQKDKKLREDYLELNINYSDFEPVKDKYFKQMGDSFESLYKWIKKPDSILIRQGISIYDEYFYYDTSDWDIKDNDPVEIKRGNGGSNRFLFYCWRSMPKGEILEDEYSRENGLICTTHEGYKYYFDPERNYFCVRGLNREGKLSYEIVEFAETDGGMLYPHIIRQPYYRKSKEDSKIYLAGYDTHRIYASDLDESMILSLDPKSLPNYVDHREITRERIERSKLAADPNSTGVVEYTGFSPLHMAVYRQDIGKVKEYLRDGAEVEPAYDSGATPMELAALSGRLDMVKLLFDHGGRFTSRAPENRCALGAAVEGGNPEILRFMLGNGAPVDGIYQQSKTAVHYAAERGNKEMVKLLIDHGADVNTRAKENETPIYNAAINSLSDKRRGMEDYIETMELLIGAGGDVDAKDRGGRTTLLRICNASEYSRMHNNTKGLLMVVKLLLDNGADANISVRAYSNPLCAAVRANILDEVKILLDGGADPFMEEDDFRPTMLPVGIARLYGYKKIEELLIEYMEPELSENREAIRGVVAKFLVSLCDGKFDEALECIGLDCPYQGSWERWVKTMHDDEYGGQRGLPDKILSVRFQSGWAEVYVERPKSFKKKYLRLGLMQYPDKSWKIVSCDNTYRDLNTVIQHVPGESLRGDLDDWREDVFEAAGKEGD